MLATIGIDFGAAYLRIAVARGGPPGPVDHTSAGRRMPFVVSRDGGNGSRRRACRISSLKRMLDFDRSLPVPPEGMSSLDCLAGILKAVKDQCLADAPGGEVNCVAAVAPCFSQRQRSAFRTALCKAGFTRVKLVDETLAILLATKTEQAEGGTIFVYALGAGTFSASLYRARGRTFEVIAQDGDRNMGGDDIDSAVATALLEKIAEVAPDAVSASDRNLLARAATTAQRAGRLLAARESFDVELAKVLGDAGSTETRAPRMIRIPWQLYDKVLSSMVAETLDRSEKLLADHPTLPPRRALLSGGLARLPQVREALAGRLGIPCEAVDEDSIARGAALYGASVDEAAWAEADFRAAGADAAQNAPSGGSPPASSWAATGGDARAPALRRWGETYARSLDAAQAQDADGQTAQAIDTLETLRADLDRLLAGLCRKAALRETGTDNREQASALLRKARGIDPTNQFIAVDLARACYERGAEMLSGGQQMEAVSVADEGADVLRPFQNGRDDRAVLLARLLHLKARALCDLGRLAEAEKAAAQSAQLDSGRAAYDEDLKRIRAAMKRAPSRQPLQKPPRGADRNRPCPCGSGKKWKNCCGR